MKIMSKAAVIAALMTAGAASPVLAQAAPGNILTLDMERLFADSDAAKAAGTQMTARYQATQNQVNTELQAADTALQTQTNAVRTALGGTQDVSKVPAATQTAFNQAQQRYAAARQNAAGLQQAVQDSQGYARDQIIQAVLPISEAVRAERRAALVVPRGSVLAVDPATDITAVVLPRLNAALKTVTIVPPEAAAAAPAAAPAAGAPRPTAPAATAPRRPQPQGR